VFAGGVTGAAVTSAVGFEVADVEPPVFVAVTTTRIVKPMSPAVSRYVGLVAEAMFVQPLPLTLQRLHW
jgi:hypothetical protein